MNVATFVVCLIVPLTDESYGFIKVLTTLFVLPVVYVMYRNDQLRRGVQKAKAKDLFLDMRSEIVPLLGILVMAACAAVVLNNLIAWTPLMKVSATYQSVTRKFFGGAVIFEILGPCIFVPILEEYVFRGLVYKRLREWLGMTWAVVISAIIFGMMSCLAPKIKNVTIDDLDWERTIDIEEVVTHNESDWSLPDDARLQYTKSEIQSYKDVLDHYETVTETKTRSVIDLSLIHI